MPRGLDNNNPLNIRKNDDRFRGEVRPSQDPDFKQFSEPGYGYRAGFMILHTYINKYGLDTIPDIINRWAPSHENPTNAYIQNVVNWSGIGENEKIDYADNEQMTRLAAAMSRMENGVPANMPDVYKGWYMYEEEKQLQKVAKVAGGGTLILLTALFTVLWYNAKNKRSHD